MQRVIDEVYFSRAKNKRLGENYASYFKQAQFCNHSSVCIASKSMIFTAEVGEQE